MSSSSRPTHSLFLCSLFFVPCSLLSACTPTPASTSTPALSAETGARLYAALCSSCHGGEGRGDTPLAGDLSPVPADFTRCNFKVRSTPSGSLPRREDLQRTVAVGIPGSAMPSFGSLVPGERLERMRCERRRPDARAFMPPSQFPPSELVEPSFVLVIHLENRAAALTVGEF